MARIHDLTEQVILSIWQGPAQTGGHRSAQYRYPQVIERIVRYVRESAARSGPVEVASEVWYTFCDEQPFGDCNKRTGMLIAVMVLEENGLELSRAQDEIAAYLNLFATSHPSRQDFRSWLQASVSPKPADEP